MRDGELRVVQLNVGSLIEPGWDERRHEVVAWLERLQPDVVCFEEVWEDASTENTARWIAAAMPDAGWHVYFGGFGFDPTLWPEPSTRFGSAVLSRWPIDHGEVHRLPVLETDELMLRSVGWELVHARTAGLDIFVCHLAPAPTHGLHRCAQVVEIDRLITEARQDLDPLPQPGGPLRAAMPAILCGDFNAEPDSDEIRYLSSFTSLDGRTAFYQDAWRVAGEGPGLTQDWRISPLAADLNAHRKRIDYVFVGDPFRREGHAGRILRAELAFHQPLTGVLASDHFGLVVDIVWPQRPG